MCCHYNPAGGFYAGITDPAGERKRKLCRNWRFCEVYSGEGGRVRFRIALLALSWLMIAAATTSREPEHAMLEQTAPYQALPEHPTRVQTVVEQQAPGQTASGQAAPEKPATITLSFVGDVMFHAENIRSVPYDNAYSGVTGELSKADLTFANFEFVLDPSRPVSGYPRFNASLEYAEAAFDAGIDVVAVANNHAADLGVEGIERTVQTLDRYRERGIVFSGIVAEVEHRFEPALIEVEEWRVGFLAVTSFLNRGERTDYVNIADYKSEDDRNRLLDVVRNHRARFDLFAVSYHGGIEYSDEPDPQKTEFFDLLVDAGVDIVWGHHPHVLQPWAFRKSEERTGLILYSLGNFVSGQSSYVDLSARYDERAQTGESVILTANFKRSSGAILLKSVDAVPIVHLPVIGHGVGVTTLDGMVRSAVPERWRIYYEDRAPILRGFVDAQPTSLFRNISELYSK